MKSTSARLRTGLLSVATATALAAALTAIPARAAGPTAAPAPAVPTDPAPSVRTVTLLTGDRVVLRTSDGRVTASLTPTSPHYGRPVEHVATPTHTWVVPKLPRSVRAHLDPSVFDVSALASRSGRVPLTVTFAPGTAPRDLPGIDVRTSSARGAAGGRTTTTASYDARRPLPASLTSSLAGVSRIAVQSVTGAPDLAPAYELHTLTINGTTARGGALPGADVFVLNTDDGRLFGAFGEIVDGQWKVSVPTGNYLILSDDFLHVVATPVTVAGDTTTSFSMSAATVKPVVTLPDHQGLSPEVDLVATDAKHTSFVDFGFGGILPRVSPLASLPSGSLFTEVANVWGPQGYEPFTSDGNTLTQHPLTHVAATKEVRAGIPHRLTFHYQPRDFARVAIRHYATGPRTDTLDGWFGLSPIDFFAFTELFPTVRPGVVHAMFEGSKSLVWDSSTTFSQGFRRFGQLDDFTTYRAGQHATIPFFRGPVTPVADVGFENGGVGRACALCVSNGVLHGFLSMASSAGTRQLGVSSEGTWQLFRGFDRIRRGRGLIVPFVRGLRAGTRLALAAQTTPAAKKQVLSSLVRDLWTFRVPAGNAPVPLLRAAYVPPTDLSSHGRAGTEAFRVSFDNLGPVDARVARASVRWSVDEKTWHAASLKRLDRNTFRVSYRNPAATRVHPYLSLRVHARDAGGRAISEQVQHAYLLPNASARPGAHRPRARAATFEPQRLCRTTGATRQYGCFVKLNAATRTTGRATPDPAGWGAPALRDAYDVPDTGSGDTVAVIVAFDYPSAEADLNHYRQQFGLPACTSASGCFTKLNQKGQAGSYPEQNQDWGVEASLDLQMISAACPTCHLVLVEANSPSDRAFGHAEDAAVAAGATVTNHSFGRIELTGDDTSGAGHYDHPGVTAVASTGDFGYGPASFPASSPAVVAVGGTTLARSSTDPRGWTERAWLFAGSGCSAYFDKLPGQSDPACHHRTEADVSAVAQGLAIYNTSLPRPFRGWLEVDGTSASSPFVAGLIGSAGTGGLRPTSLYGNPASFNDVVGGSNGFCQGSYLCTAVAGYDGPTGLGSPQGISPFAVP